MSRLQWIVFDSTGTLMTPAPEPAQIYHQTAAKFGSARSVDQVRDDLRAAMRRHFFGDSVDDPTDEGFERERWRRIVADTVPEIDRANFDTAFQSLWQHFAEPSSWHLFGDVTATLRRMRSRGYRIAIASNFDARLRPIVAGLGLDELVDEILISSDLGFSKPSTQFYRMAADRLQASVPESLLMIGDTYRGDVEAAERAGWRARHLVRDRDDALWQLTADL